MPVFLLLIYSKGYDSIRGAAAPTPPLVFVTPDTGVTARLRGPSGRATAFVASQHAYNLLCKLLTSRSRPKDACASALWKPAQKLFKKVLQNADVRIPELVAVLI